MARRHAGYDLGVDKQQLKFAEKMAAELRRAGAEEPLEIDEEQFRIVRGSQIFNLHNAYAEWEAATRLRRNAVLRFFATSLSEPPEPPDSVDEARPEPAPPHSRARVVRLGRRARPRPDRRPGRAAARRPPARHGTCMRLARRPLAAVRAAEGPSLPHPFRGAEDADGRRQLRRAEGRPGGAGPGARRRCLRRIRA